MTPIKKITILMYCGFCLAGLPPPPVPFSCSGPDHSIIKTDQKKASTDFIILIFFFYPDVNTSQPDKKSIMTYVMCLFQSLPSSELDDSCFDFSDSGSIASPITEQSSMVGFRLHYPVGGKTKNLINVFVFSDVRMLECRSV